MWHQLNITTKLIVTLGFVVVAGFSSLVIQQWLTLDKGMTQLANNNRYSMVSLLAQNVGGGIRWKKAAVIENAYSSFVSAEDSDVSNIISTDLDGNLITEFSHESLPGIDLATITKSSIKSLEEESVSLTILSADHTVVLTRVYSGKKNTPVGYFSVAFSNNALNGFITSQSLFSVIIAIVAIFTIIAALFIVIRQLFSRPMMSLNNVTQELATGDGDLTRRLELKSRDELGEFAGTINAFIEKLQLVMGKVVASAEDVRGSISVANESAQQNEQLLNQHTVELDAANSALQTMSGSLERMSNAAQGLADSTGDASVVAESANKVADQAVEAVKNLTDRVAQIETVIHDLDDRTKNIGSVLDVIKGIAEQTNLLALNAAIEAARAGEQGRGFAVVADEVRTLASRTQQSTAEIQVIIESLQSGAQAAVSTMSQSQKDVVESASQINMVKDYLAKIVRCMDNISETNNAVAIDVNEQSIVARGVSDNISQISNLSVSLLENGKSTSSACEQLSNLNDDLHRHVSFFKV